MENFCEQYGLPLVAPSKKHKKSHKNKEHKDYKRSFKRFKKINFEPNEFYKKEKRKPKQRIFKKKSGCYKCGKSGHFVKDCKAKDIIKQLKISTEEQENLIRMPQVSSRIS
jgi:hypothetical protein